MVSYPPQSCSFAKMIFKVRSKMCPETPDAGARETKNGREGEINKRQNLSDSNFTSERACNSIRKWVPFQQSIEMDLTNEQLLTHLRDVEVLAEDVLADKQVFHDMSAPADMTTN